MTVRTAIKRFKTLARTAWDYPRKPLNVGTALKRSPMKHGGKPLNRAKPIAKRSPERAADQARWNLITSAKIAAGGCCERCGSVHRTDRGPGHRLCGHHRQLASQGGAWDESNHVLFCGDCHSWSHSNPAAAVADGWIVVVHQQITPVQQFAPSMRGNAQ